MTELPQTAIDAATRGVLAVFGADRTAASESIIRYALAAAAPHIAAAERERIRSLAVARGATCANTPDWPDIAANTYPPPAGVIMFASLLTEGDTT